MHIVDRWCILVGRYYGQDTSWPWYEMLALGWLAIKCRKSRVRTFRVRWEDMTLNISSRQQTSTNPGINTTRPPILVSVNQESIPKYETWKLLSKIPRELITNPTVNTGENWNFDGTSTHKKYQYGVSMGSFIISSFSYQGVVLLG